MFNNAYLKVFGQPLTHGMSHGSAAHPAFIDHLTPIGTIPLLCAVLPRSMGYPAVRKFPVDRAGWAANAPSDPFF